MQQFLHILLEPDNLPIAGMVLLVAFLLGVWWRQADRPLVDPALPDTVTTWPHLVRIEFLVTLAAMVGLTVWSILVDAPLEEAANPNRTPDPSKAPWYFLGLQELLVYFDPWIAGVMLPLLIVSGLCAIPYLDPNPRGNGVYTWRERPFAIATFLFGFLGLWIVPLVIGVFCRGPGWNWYWPWEPWHLEKTAHLTNRNLTDLLGVPVGPRASVMGGLCVGAWFGAAWLFWRWRRHTPTMRALGGVRYTVTALLWLAMMGVPVKMALRLLLNVKYVWTTPYFNV